MAARVIEAPAAGAADGTTNGVGFPTVRADRAGRARCARRGGRA